MCPQSRTWNHHNLSMLKNGDMVTEAYNIVTDCSVSAVFKFDIE
jgi:hypothetical protein